MINLVLTMVFVFIIFYLLRNVAKKLYFINIYIFTIIAYIFILLFILAIVFTPEQTINSVLQGIYLCVNVIFPSLFPFFVATELLISLGFVHIISIALEPIMRPLFNVPGSGSFSFAIGIISGYPVGAKAVVNLRENNLCSKIEAERLLTFCNNSGPLFILGSVAVGMFNNASLGIILFLSHILASLTVGFCFRFYKFNKKDIVKSNNRIYSKNTFKEFSSQLKKSKQNDNRNFGEIFGDAIKNSVNLLLVISGFIIFFSVLITIMNHFNIIGTIANLLEFFLLPFSINKQLITTTINGFFEITTAIKAISSYMPPSLIQKLIVSSLVLGWGGLSVHCQVISIISKSDISIIPYIVGKALQGIFSAIYIFILFNLMPINISVLAALNSPIEYLVTPDLLRSLYASAILLGNMLLFFIIIYIFSLIFLNKHNKETH